MSVALLGLMGCSHLVDFSDECKVNADCENDQLCSQAFCIPKVQPTTDAAGPNDMGTDGDPQDQGVPNGPLVLDPELCHTLYGVTPEQAKAKNTILIGMLLPRTGPHGVVGLSREHAAALAISEINERGAFDGYRFGLIACDTASNVDKGILAAEWLVANTPIKAIIGAASSSVTIQVFTQVAMPNGIVMISPSSTAPSITDIPDDNLLWRTAPTDALQGAAIGALLLDRDVTKVAIINRDSAYGNGLVAPIRNVLCDADRCGSDALFNRRYATDIDGFEIAQIMSELTDFEPDVVVLISLLEDAVGFLRLADGAGLNQFVVTDAMRNVELIDPDVAPDVIDNLVGTAPSTPDGETFNGFVFRYTGLWGEEPRTYNAQTYDAAYLLAYAYSTLGDQEATGPLIAAGLTRLSSGTLIEAGGDTWQEGVRALRASASATLNYNGVSGPLDFNAQGEAGSNIEAWRLDRAEGAIVPLGVLYTADGTYHPIATDKK